MLNQVLKFVVPALILSFACRHTGDVPLGNIEDVYRQPKNSKFSNSQTADNLVRAMVGLEYGIQRASYEVDQNGDMWFFFDVDALNNLNRLQTKKVRLSGMKHFAIANDNHRYRVNFHLDEGAGMILIDGVWQPYQPKDTVSFAYYNLFTTAKHIKTMLTELQLLAEGEQEQLIP